MTKLEQYIKLVEELKALGEEILEECEEYTSFEDEVECMDMHLECCLRILSK